MPAVSKGVRIQTSVRLPADLHRRVADVAHRRRWSLNEVLCEALRAHLPGEHEDVGAWNPSNR